LKRSTIFVLVPYSDSVYKTPKTHFDLLLLKTATREEKSSCRLETARRREKDSWSHLYSTLVFFRLLQMNRREFQVYQEEEGRRRRRRSRRKDREGLGHGGCLYENPKYPTTEIKLLTRDPSDL
jgi:hypothetical protein